MSNQDGVAGGAAGSNPVNVNLGDSSPDQDDRTRPPSPEALQIRKRSHSTMSASPFNHFSHFRVNRSGSAAASLSSGSSSSSSNKKSVDRANQGCWFVDIDDAVNPPPRRNVGRSVADYDPDNTKVLELRLPEYKAIFHLVFLLQQSIEPKLDITEYISVQRLMAYEAKRVAADSTRINVEHAMHCFVTRVNFVILRVLALMRKSWKQNGNEVNITLYDILLNDKTMADFAILVTILWYDMKREQGKMGLRPNYAIAKTDEQRVQHEGWLFNLKEKPEENMPFPPVASYLIREPRLYGVGTDEAFETFEHPNNFFIRLALQSVHKHKIDHMNYALNQAEVPVQDKRVDASKSALIGKCVLPDIGPAFLQTMTHLQTRYFVLKNNTEQIKQERILEWMAKTQENAVTLATLVALIASGGRGDANANNYRLRLQKRWDLTVELIIEEIVASIIDE